MSTLWASDWAVLGPDWPGLSMFSGLPTVGKGGMRLESHLGHSIPPRQRGFCFNVWTLTLRGSL
jgi:hypothetical protein